MTLPETTQEHLPPQYKRTEVGIIPVDWMVKFLRKISLMKSGESITSAKIDESSPYPCYGGNGLRGFTDKYTHDGDYVLIGRQGALCGNVVRVAGQFYASEHAVVATPRDGVDVDWLSFILDTMQLNRISESSAQPGLSVQKVLSLQSVVPPSEDEQRAIATALSDADALIESLDRLIAKKRAIKQAAMKQLLTGETRLEGFEGSWKTKRLEEISTITIGRTPNRDNPDLWGEGYVWLSIADLDRKVVDRSKEHITDLAARGMRIVEEGTLLMSFKLSIGRVCFQGATYSPTKRSVR
jgi:type I restriction enzyme S subunit